MKRRFTIENFRSISIVDSSSPFEGIFAFYTCIMINYFLYKKRGKALICLLITDMIFNHLTSSGSVTMWILVYLSIYYFNKESSIVREQQACIDSDAGEALI